jgi:hypothetical protein
MVQEGQSFLWPGMSDNRKHKISEVGSGEPERGAFGNPMGDGRVRLSSTPAGLEDEMIQGRVIETDTLRENVDPREIQRRRSETSRKVDAAKDAPLTTDPLQWASSPSEYDFPGVDTGPTFRDTEGEDYDTDSLLESLF